MAKEKWEQISGEPWVKGASAPEIKVFRLGDKLRIVQPSVTSHVMDLNLKTGDGITAIFLDKGVYSDWVFRGMTGRDTLMFGPTGTIISKRRGGIVIFNAGKEVKPVLSKFVFTNKINVARTQEKHPGVVIHPLNHLQKVVIKGAAPDDEAILQGNRFRLGAADRSGALRGVPVDRLRVA